MAQKRKYKISYRFFALVAVLCAVALLGVYLSQQQKLKEITAIQDKLVSELDDLTSEEKRLEFMIEYRKSPEGKIQYVREKFGFVKEDDIVFDLNN